jgi:hypothetical protein
MIPFVLLTVVPLATQGGQGYTWISRIDRPDSRIGARAG